MRELVLAHAASVSGIPDTHGFATSKLVLVTDGNEIALVDRGRYAVHLIVLKYKYLSNGGIFEHYWTASPVTKL